MKVGVPREIKPDENRVALTPAGAAALVADGHDVLIERSAGAGSGFADADYEPAGARIVAAETAWNAELVLKVKEPTAAEYSALTSQILFTYLHLAGVDPALTEALLASHTTAVAYETVEDSTGRLPLLAPMSAVAGAMAVAMGNFHLARFNGGRGMLLGRIFDRRFGDVLVVGDGVAGSHAARAAAGLGAKVCVVGLESDRLPELQRFIGTDFRFIRSAPETLASEIRNADLVIGAVLLHGARAPHVISEAMVKTMQRGAVIVDISIDQGGCVATSRPTTHHDPVFEKHGVIHYCVTNMPGAYPRLSTLALTEATLPYVRRLAARGLDALREDPGFGKGLNTLDGRIACRPVAEALGRLDRYAPLA
ncbi:MAG: alanine dehydrogenase [Gammaproteobacteria bacterium]|nr:alanine dehydrogenase [Gammaproteobacteria bacterium]